MQERTLMIIKPDAVSRNLIGRILSQFEDNGLTIIAMRMVSLKKKDAEGFYQVHKGKSFFESLVQYMSSGKCVLAVLEGENAISKVREIMGATDPQKASDGTIRKKFGINIEKNSVHGSDSKESANFEIKFFFPELESNQNQDPYY